MDTSPNLVFICCSFILVFRTAGENDIPQLCDTMLYRLNLVSGCAGDFNEAVATSRRIV